MKFFKKKTCCESPNFGKWGEPEEVCAGNSFSTTTKIIQKRTCNQCGLIEINTLSVVRSES